MKFTYRCEKFVSEMGIFSQNISSEVKVLSKIAINITTIARNWHCALLRTVLMGLLDYMTTLH